MEAIDFKLFFPESELKLINFLFEKVVLLLQDFKILFLAFSVSFRIFRLFYWLFIFFICLLQLFWLSFLISNFVLFKGYPFRRYLLFWTNVGLWHFSNFILLKGLLLVWWICDGLWLKICYVCICLMFAGLEL